MSATISQCGRYRYTLARDWSDASRVAFIGVNPSTADASTDDATVRKWRGFAQRWGFGGFVVGNLFAWRATDVRELAKAGDPVGHENNEHLRAILDGVDLVVPCWGSRDKLPPSLRHRIADVGRMLRACASPVRIFGVTASGDPKHPLMLGYGTSLTEWSAMTNTGPEG